MNSMTAAVIPTSVSLEDIPLHARIIAVADAFDAMTSDRPYRKALAFEAAFAELRTLFRTAV
jgi:HD-GYP domain-containing protein (c-di-GMP phosphodiesterase class II)